MQVAFNSMVTIFNIITTTTILLTQLLQFLLLLLILLALWKDLHKYKHLVEQTVPLVLATMTRYGNLRRVSLPSFLHLAVIPLGTGWGKFYELSKIFQMVRKNLEN